MSHDGGMSLDAQRALMGSREVKNHDHDSWDPMDIHKRAIFYAGQRVFLLPDKEMGDPDCLTPDEGIGIPRSRDARREIYKQKLEKQRKDEARAKMTPKELEEQQKKGQEALHRFKKPDKRKPEKKKEPKKPKGLFDLMETLHLEDPRDWEQCSQAGCTFWRKLSTREIRLEKPAMKDDHDPPPKAPERYPLGTGSMLYDHKGFTDTRGWLCERGMSLPQLVPRERKKAPTKEDLEKRRRFYAAKTVQKHGREFIERQRERDEKDRAAEEEAAAFGEEVRAGGGDGQGGGDALNASLDTSYGDDSYYDDEDDNYEEEDEDEGSTSNDRSLLTFRSGVFVCGEPVYPVALRYPFAFQSPMFGESFPGTVLKLASSLWWRLEAIHLPVYHPSEAEKADPKLYAENVRRVIAAAMDNPPVLLSDIRNTELNDFWRKRSVEKVPLEELISEEDILKYAHAEPHLPVPTAQARRDATTKVRHGDASSKEVTIL